MNTTPRRGLYGGWLGRIAQQFQRHFDEIETVYNFEYGDEFEMALCDVLRRCLPSRLGVCRGYVVGRDGECAGNDIIILDAQRYPTLRFLGDDLTRRQQVPADAVYAYIEAKHALIAEGTSGQSLAKAVRQVSRVKSVPRERVDLQTIMPGLSMGGASARVHRPPGLPRYRNPMYGAIWARSLKTAAHPGFGDVQVILARLRELRLPKGVDPLTTPLDAKQARGLPDLIVAGTCLVCPTPRAEVEGTAERLMPFLCDDTELVGAISQNTLGFAVAHLLLAIDLIQLAPVPWGEMMHEELGIERRG